jgi:hypothetical protein
MTIKLIELQVEIPDSVVPLPTNEQICNAIQLALQQSGEYKSIGCIPVTEIKVKMTMPSWNRPDAKEQHEETFNTNVP